MFKVGTIDTRTTLNCYIFNWNIGAIASRTKWGRINASSKILELFLNTSHIHEIITAKKSVLKILCVNPTIRKCQIHYLHDKKPIDFKLSSYRSKTITFKSIRKIAQSISKNLPNLTFSIDRKHLIDYNFTSYRLQNRTYSIDKNKPIDCSFSNR